MTEIFGPGVSRTLTAAGRQFAAVVWQQLKPPTDAELNLMSQIDGEKWRQYTQSLMPSGWLIDPVRATEDYVTNQLCSNQFYLGQTSSGETQPSLWAHVNGWVVPVAGSAIADAVQNRIRLYPPPTTDSRIDLVFLEVWAALVAPNPSVENKPSASTLYRYGNTEYGDTSANLADDLEDPAIGYETTERVQVQYRIRVVGSGATGVSLDAYPDGLTDPNVFGQGTESAPVQGQVFTSMAQTLGDAGLWRAGPGLADENSANPLGTVDGYVYAVPLCSVFRRNSSAFVASTSANHNGAYNRNQGATSPGGAKEFVELTLTQALTASTTGSVLVSGLSGSGFDGASQYLNSQKVFALIGDEVVSISGTSAAGVNPATVTIDARGRAGTFATAHPTGSTIQFWTYRPDGLFADEVAATDILDLRRAVTPGQWNYDQILQHNLLALFNGTLHTTYKQSYVGTAEGLKFLDVSTLLADGGTAVPANTEAVDGPDGIRTMWSDSATLQTDVTLFLNPGVGLTNGFTTTTFDQGVYWDVGANLKPSGFVPDPGTTGWKNGTSIFLYLGGEDNTLGARATFRDGSTRAVRFVGPSEYWRDVNATSKQHPVSLRWLEEHANHPWPGGTAADSSTVAQHPGPQHPLAALKFERPYIVLGGLLHSSLRVTTVAANTKLFNMGGGLYEIDVGIDFDSNGNFALVDGGGNLIKNNDTTSLLYPLLRGERTFYDMLTGGGLDATGESSEIYVVLYGDDSVAGAKNNGAFKVIGAGTLGYTIRDAASANRVVVQALDPDFANFATATGKTLTAEFRSQHMNTTDGSTFGSGLAAAVVVLTDIGGKVGLDGDVNAANETNPWSSAVLNPGGARPDYSIPAEVNSAMVLNLSLLYHPGRGATTRVADKIHKLAVVTPGSEYLRQSLTTLDTTLTGQTGYPAQEIEFDPAHLQVWNRLSGLGLDAPNALKYGGEVVLQSEQDREHELFVDPGSKTVVFRPYQQKGMTLAALPLKIGNSLVGDTTYFTTGDPKDGAGIFTANMRAGIAIPPEYMPRFGRQDIPYYRDTGATKGAGAFLEGVDHLFLDSTDETHAVFNIIGGLDNLTAGNEVTPLLFQTGATSGLDYCEYGTLIVATKDAYQARLVNDTTVLSSDFGSGLKGIELPPYHGIARLYGVYERTNYVAAGGATWDATRVNLEASPATNLLRTDRKNQTLFIRKNGAEDFTQETGDHTYVVPSEVIDLTKIPTYDPNLAFEDYEYVVECVVFGFAKGWIDQNNYVLLRRHNGEGTLRNDTTYYEFAGVRMVLPCAAPLNDQAYLCYSRTPYQGDPYMTRNGATREVRDYTPRYGQVPVASAYGITTPLQQVETDGTSAIETPNPRAFEILASADFYTTLGTGKPGGKVYAGTLADVGHVEDTASSSTRLPGSATANDWRVIPRAFSKGQHTNPNRARLLVDLKNTPIGMEDATITIESPNGTAITMTAKAPLNYTVATGEFRIEDEGLEFFPATPATLTFTNILAGAADTDNLTVTMPAEPGDTVTVNCTTLETGLVLRAWVSASNTVRVQLYNATAAPINPADGQTFAFHVVRKSTFGSRVRTATNLAQALSAHPDIVGVLAPVYASGTQVVLTAAEPGAAGNLVKVTVVGPPGGFAATNYWGLVVPSYGYNFGTTHYPTTAYLSGGVDLPVNAGTGTTQIDLTGLTDRLPLGVLVQDHDFLGEDALSGAGALYVAPGRIQPRQRSLPLTGRGTQEHTRFFGTPGEKIGMADGSILGYAATGPGAVHKYRVNRGGSCWVMTGPRPGGPLDWAIDTWTPADKPVLRGAVLVGKALLVRNFAETAFNTNTPVSDGDEIQMVVLTNTVLGNGSTVDDGIVLRGEIGPTGYGEGYAAAERYRIEGRPMLRHAATAPDADRTSNTSLKLAVYLGREE